MNVIRILLAFLLVSVSIVGSAQNPTNAEEWDRKFQDFEKRSPSLGQAQKIEVLRKLRKGIDGASCKVQARWHELAVNTLNDGTERDSLLRELSSVSECIEPQEFFATGTVLGAYYYEHGKFDSAFFGFTGAFNAAVLRRDTNQMVLALSNLAAQYSEMDWKVEALSTALRAYTLSRQSSQISGLTRLFLNNNVAGLQLDLGYVNQAKRILSDYELAELTSDAEQIHVLRAVNHARIRLHEAKGKLSKVRGILEGLELNTSAWMMATSFAVTDSGVSGDVLSYIHESYLRKFDELDSDTATLVGFGIPAIGVIALSQRVDERLRLKASMLREYSNLLPLGGARLAFKLAMAQLFGLSDYWEDYWAEAEAVKKRDIKYASLQSEVLSAFNKQVGLENSVLLELNATKLFVHSLVGVASVLLASALALLFWVHARYKRSLIAHRVLVAENERLAKDHLVQLTYFDEVKALVRKAGRTIKVEVLDDLLARMERDRPSALIEIPDSALKPFELTPTEAKVLIQLAYGYRNAEIAQMLNISKSYIHNVRSKLRQKLPLQPNEGIEEFAASLRKSYEPTKIPGSERTSR